MRPLSFQDIIIKLQNFWVNQGCVLMQPYDMEVGAGTLHPATTLRALGPKPWRAAYVQPSRRPKDGRYGENPNRLQHYYQFQVLLKPSPENIQNLCLKSLAEIGINPDEHDIRFVEDDWENPTIGAWGLGWEVWCDGMEVLQYTYMQQIGGIDCVLIPGELTYGLERLTMYIQNVEHFKDIVWTYGNENAQRVLYGDIYMRNEKESSAYCLEYADTEMLFRHFKDAQKESLNMLEKKLAIPAYEQCLKACHLFNLLDARGVLSVTERASYISKVRELAKECCKTWMENE